MGNNAGAFQEYQTPPELFAELDGEFHFGNIDLNDLLDSLQHEFDVWAEDARALSPTIQSEEEP